MTTQQASDSHVSLSTRIQHGFILPTLIVFSLVLVSAGLVVLQYVSASTGRVQSTYYTSLAKTAADAGANMALSCIKRNQFDWTIYSRSLRPESDCTGNPVGVGRSTYLSQASNNQWRSSFSVGTLEETEQGVAIVSEGRVDFFYSGSSTPSRSFTQTTKLYVPVTSTNDIRQMAQGTAVTKIRGGEDYSCGIANQSLYCWGQRDAGQTGTGRNTSSPDQLTPEIVNTGDIANQRITDVDVGPYNGCVVANGYGSCWGPNNIGQLGIGNAPGYYVPTRVGGDLASRFVQQIKVGTSSDNFNSTQFTCALAQRQTYCWGASNYGQLGQPNYSYDWFGNINGIENRPDVTTGVPYHDATQRYPALVFGYGARPYENQSQLYGKAISDLEAGSYDACGITNGHPFCWGHRFAALAVGNGVPIDARNWQDRSGTSLNGKLSTDIADGESTACAIADGEAHCWGPFAGDGNFNPLNLPDIFNLTSRQVLNGPGADTYGAGMVQVNTNDDNGPICINGAGNIYCWGRGTTGYLSPGLKNVNIETSSVTDVAGGKNFACLVANGSAYCMGQNGGGQLGDGTKTARTQPNKVSTIGLTSGEAATKISSGSDHSCAVVNGYIYCWGRNNKGQLGETTRLNRNQPYGIAISTYDRAATDVSAGYEHSCGIINNFLYCWGSNDFGQLGNGASNTSTSYPVQVGGSLNNKAVTSVGAGVDHTCAVANSQVYCWGANTRGQLGNNSTVASTTPVPVQGLSGLAVTKVVSGDKFSCALADLRVYCWGDNTFGQISRSTSSIGGTQLTANLVNGAPASSAFTDVTAGKDFACAIVDGLARCWGNNATRQLGRASDASNQWQVLNVDGALATQNTSSIAAGDGHACSITNGTAYCWGAGASGQIGDGGASQRATPVAVTAGAGSLGDNYPYAISAGNTSSCAIGNAKITCWGAGSYGQMGNATNPSLQISPASWIPQYIRQQRTYDLANSVIL